MRIGLLGTRGIPNRYGGFEELAEHVSKYWADNGHEVYVYCISNGHKEYVQYKNITQVFIDATKYFSQFIYDYRSTRHALKLNLDIIYHAGYATSLPGNIILKKGLNGKLVYNMDGLEWKRSKFNLVYRILVKGFERAAVKSGSFLVADNKGVQNYLLKKYNTKSSLIEYGADLFNPSKDTFFGYPDVFDLVIARFEPENHIEQIVAAYEKNVDKYLVLVSNKGTRLHRKLEKRIKSADNIIFNGPIYDKVELAFLKSHCRYYIHGHSVGGTNPSLIEALAAGCNILIHNNEFNRDVVREHAHAWTTQHDLEILIKIDLKRLTSINRQKEYSLKRFNWKEVAQKHLELFQNVIILMGSSEWKVA